MKTILGRQKGVALVTAQSLTEQAPAYGSIQFDLEIKYLGLSD
jgi:hypothetical protein